MPRRQTLFRICRENILHSHCSRLRKSRRKPTVVEATQPQALAETGRLLLACASRTLHLRTVGVAIGFADPFYTGLVCVCLQQVLDCAQTC